MEPGAEQDLELASEIAEFHHDFVANVLCLIHTPETQ
jgi:hypothetical protein